MSFDQSSFHKIDAFVEAEVRRDPDAFLLPERVVEAMQRNGVQIQEIDQIIGPIEVRVGDGATSMLTPDASERAARLAHVISLAQKVFGSQQKAFLWLRAHHAQLGGKTPINCVRRETGARFVEELLIRIDNGIAA